MQPSSARGLSRGTRLEMTADQTSPKPARKRRRWRRWALVSLLAIALMLTVGRILLPMFVRDYVIATVNRTHLYQCEIGDIDMWLWRGGYTINDVRVMKVTGNVPAPLFEADRVDLALEWNALLRGSAVGRMTMHRPELNFVDSESDSGDQTGAGGPWLQIIRGLFPFRINSARVVDGSVHFRAVDRDPTVDIYLSEVNGTVENLTNITNTSAPLLSTIEATGLAMDHAKVEWEMKLDPFSYRPTFQLAVRLLNLDVTRTNSLSRAYGSFDFESGWFDLVVEIDAKEGMIEGYVKPLFRDLQVFDLSKDAREGDPLRVFWEALVGVTTQIFSNPRRDQFGTLIPFTGDVSAPNADILSTIGNVLRNAFIRAYLPRLQGQAPDINDLQFSPASEIDPGPTTPG